MSELRVDIARCGNCGATVPTGQVSCEYCGVRFSAPSPPAASAPAAAPPVPAVAVQPAVPVQPPQTAPLVAAAPAVAPSAPSFERLTSVLMEIVSDPAIQLGWKHGCNIWQRWSNDEKVSKHDMPASDKVEAILTSAYLIPWYESEFDEAQWHAFAEALAATSGGTLDVDMIEAEMETWDEELDEGQEENWDAFVAWIAETIPEGNLRRAAYEFAVAAAAIDGQRSTTDAEVLDALAEALEIPEKEALLLQSRIAQRLVG